MGLGVDEGSVSLRYLESYQEGRFLSGKGREFVFLLFFLVNDFRLNLGEGGDSLLLVCMREGEEPFAASPLSASNDERLSLDFPA